MAATILVIADALRTPERDAAFWRRIDVGDPDACWLWRSPAQLTQSGYGAAHYGPIHTVAHRIAYMLAKGEIPAGAGLLHSCDVRRCCNPAHLRPVTPQENADDMVAKVRSRGPVIRGEANGRCKLPDLDVRRVRRLGPLLPRRVLAEVYDLSESQIGNILAGTSR